MRVVTPCPWYGDPPAQGSGPRPLAQLGAWSSPAWWRGGKCEARPLRQRPGEPRGSSVRGSHLLPGAFPGSTAQAAAHRRLPCLPPPPPPPPPALLATAACHGLHPGEWQHRGLLSAKQQLPCGLSRLQREERVVGAPRAAVARSQGGVGEGHVHICLQAASPGTGCLGTRRPGSGEEIIVNTSAPPYL